MYLTKNTHSAAVIVVPIIGAGADFALHRPHPSAVSLAVHAPGTVRPRGTESTATVTVANKCDLPHVIRVGFTDAQLHAVGVEPNVTGVDHGEGNGNATTTGKNSNVGSFGIGACGARGTQQFAHVLSDPAAPDLPLGGFG